MLAFALGQENSVSIGSILEPKEDRRRYAAASAYFNAAWILVICNMCPNFGTKSFEWWVCGYVIVCVHMRIGSNKAASCHCEMC